jgi:hypothetical protein
MNTTFDSIVLNREALPIEIPAGYTGPLTFPGNGKGDVPLRVEP